MTTCYLCGTDFPFGQTAAANKRYCSCRCLELGIARFTAPPSDPEGWEARREAAARVREQYREEDALTLSTGKGI